MIGKVCKRGSDVKRLLGYLFREGLAGERGLSAPHTAPRLIAAWDGADGLEPPTTARGKRELERLAETLNAPLLAAGLDRDQWKQARPVYHLAIAAAKDDPVLADAQWADIAAKYLHRIGLTRAATRGRCGGWRCGTPTTTCTSWRRSPARTGGGCGRATTSTAPEPPLDGRSSRTYDCPYARRRDGCDGTLGSSASA